MKQLKRTLLTLVALIAVTTGAWAQTASYQMKELVPPKEWENAGMLYVTDMPSDFKAISIEEAMAWTGAPTTGTAYIFYDFGDISPYGGNTSYYVQYKNGNSSSSSTGWTKGYLYSSITAGDFVVYYPAKPAGTPVAITWDDATKTATIDKMPAGNVTVTPAYFKQAEFADQGAPKAEKDVLANTDAPLVSEGQVKNIDGTETPQGTVMYYAAQQDGNTAPTAPDYDADGWTDQVPTADGLQKGKVYVWYYIQGAEPAQGTDRTDDNTCSDSNITPLGTDGYVELGPEPVYTVEFAEGTNEAPNSWTVDPTEATDPGVTKDTKVTLTYQGPRKVIGVKAEKKSAKPVTLATAHENGAVVVIDYIWAGNTTVFTFTNDNGTYSCNVTGYDANYFTGSSLTYYDKKHVFIFTATHSQDDKASLSIQFYPSTNSFYIAQKGRYYQSFTISVNGTDIKSQLKEEK